MTELKMKEMQLINWFGCPNLIYTRERIHLAAMLATDEEMKKNLYRVCEGTNKSKRKNDKNAKKYHESFASCEVI